MAVQSEAPQEVEVETVDTEIEPSGLDELTHAELCLICRESAHCIRFAKGQQWKSLGATLLVFAALMVIANFHSDNTIFIRVLAGISFLLSAGAIYTLVIYQVWQNSEREKIKIAAKFFSNVARRIRSLKSDRESNYFRYTLLVFMISMVIAANIIVIVDLTRYLGD